MGKSVSLTHEGRDKMADIFQTTVPDAFSIKNIWVSFNISLNFVPEGPINTILVLVQIMSWHRRHKSNDKNNNYNNDADNNNTSNNNSNTTTINDNILI